MSDDDADDDADDPTVVTKRQALVSVHGVEEAIRAGDYDTAKDRLANASDRLDELTGDAE